MQLIEQRLAPLGFSAQYFERNGTLNGYFTAGDTTPLLCFAGTPDVVPPGDLDAWTHDPFAPTIRDGMLIGRGACDMKSAVAASSPPSKSWHRNSRPRSEHRH